MAIKQRKPAAADIEAFGDAADRPTPPTAQPPAEAQPRQQTAPATPAPVRGDAWPTGLARTLTLRYPDPAIPQLLAELAELDERSQHNTAIRALRRGLDDLKREAGL